MRLMLLVCGLFASLSAFAGVEDVIRKSLERAAVRAPVEAIVPSPMPGVYQVNVRGGRVLYVSEDGRFFLQGTLYAAQEGHSLNLTEPEERKGLLALMEQVPAGQFLVYPASRKKTNIVVFTDTECPFCHKLHEDIEQLTEAGISVRYLAYPRKGPDSSAAETLAKVWCAEDRREAMDRAVADRRVSSSACANPIKEHFALGQTIGVQGTPTIILANGRRLTGYVAPEELIKAALDAAK
jgi:thiol:disulfide interchange protein DsbC